MGWEATSDDDMNGGGALLIELETVKQRLAQAETADAPAAGDESGAGAGYEQVQESPGDSVAAPSQAWDVQIALDTEDEDLVWRLTFLRAVLMRGPVTKVYSTDPNLVLPLDSGIPYSDYFCGVEIALNTMAATVTVSKTASDVYDTAIPGDYSRVRRLLYKLRATVSGETQTVENTAWAVIEDYRHIPELGVYI